MQIKPNQLSTEISKSLASCYLVSGNELLIVQECADTIRRVARDKGCLERQRIVIERQEDWLSLAHCTGSLSLFSERKLIEVQIQNKPDKAGSKPYGNPGKAGSKALLEYLDEDREDVLLVISGSVDKQSRKSKWYTALDRAGITIPVWPPSPSELPTWLATRMKMIGMTATPDALALLAERVEGNLLAAAQEIEKLRLIYKGKIIEPPMIVETVSDNARYDAFRLVDVAHAGDARAAIRTLKGLRVEGVPVPILLWAISREIRLMVDLKQDLASNKSSIAGALTKRGVWSNRQSLLQTALNRLDLDDLSSLQELAFQADGASKGYLPGSPWDHLEKMVVLLAQGGSTNNVRAPRA